MPLFRHTYPKARYYYPHGTVQPNQIVESLASPEPAFFERVNAADYHGVVVPEPVVPEPVVEKPEVEVTIDEDSGADED